MVGGYVVAGSEGLLLLITKGEQTARYPGWPEHQVYTVMASQWLRIPLVDPMSLILTTDTLNQHDAASPAPAPARADGLSPSDDDDLSTDSVSGSGSDCGGLEKTMKQEDPKSRTAPARKSATKRVGRRTDTSKNRPHLRNNLEAAAILSRFDMDGTFFWAETYDLTSHFGSSPPCVSDGIAEVSPTRAKHTREPFEQRRVSQQDMWSVSESEFVWNENLTEPFSRIGLRSFCPVLLRGMCQTSVWQDIKGQPMNLTMVTRMRNLNPGSRYDARGLHHTNPGVGNEYETELLLFQEADTLYTWASVALSRGTVPVRWSQKLKKTHVNASLSMDSQPYRGVAQFWESIWSRYGTSRFVCINLLRSNAVAAAAAAGQTVPAMPSYGSCQIPQRGGGSAPVSPTVGDMRSFAADEDDLPFARNTSALSTRVTNTRLSTYLSAVQGELAHAVEDLEQAAADQSAAVFESLLADASTSRPAATILFTHTEALSRSALIVTSWRTLDQILATLSAEGQCLRRNDGRLSPRTLQNSLQFDIGDSDKALGIDGDGEDEGPMFDDNEESDDEADDMSPPPLNTTVSSVASLRDAPEPEQVKTINGVNFKGEPLLSYVFESSLHALDRKMERQEWEKQGIASQKQGDRMQHCAVPHGEEATDADDDAAAQLLKQPQFHNTHVRHVDWHTTVKKVGERRTAESLWKAMHPYMRDFGYSRGEMWNGDDGAYFIRRDRVQRGVYRFNCADSLDRTNLACFYYCVQIVNEATRWLAHEGPNEDDWGMMMMDHDRALGQMPKQMVETLASTFVNNGDVCAMIYCNSPAMHSGRLRGLAADDEKQKKKKSNLEIAISRRYQNQFTDQKRTRCLYTFLGRDTALQELSSYRRLTRNEVARAVLILHERPVGFAQTLTSADGLVSLVSALNPDAADEAAQPEVTAVDPQDAEHAASASDPPLPVLLLLFTTMKQAEQCVQQDPFNRLLVNTARYAKYQQDLLHSVETVPTKTRAALNLVKAIGTRDIANSAKEKYQEMGKKLRGFGFAVKKMAMKDSTSTTPRGETPRALTPRNRG
eukprot:TRINITY_DN4892_c0_g1_i1.p1 TRINITY_DN4892_c0_g1~~TRINITY_DN4892_c0_g1_i1.p1  ORF type:complete len:1142 (+),score=161.28 TRINITY_DN4892_c0_g1_i1:254-3427(+)